MVHLMNFFTIHVLSFGSVIFLLYIWGMQDFKDAVLETRSRSVHYCSFPGFSRQELTELPGKMEAPHVLHRVTKAQDFNVGLP